MYRAIGIWVALIIIIVINCFIDFKVIPSIPLVILQVFLEPVYWFVFWLCLNQFSSVGREREKTRRISFFSITDKVIH